MLSFDATNGEDSAALYDDGDIITTSSTENIVEDRIILDKLIKRFQELDPDADRIIQLLSENDKISDRKIAEALGRPQRTFADQMKRYRKELHKIYDE